MLRIRLSRKGKKNQPFFRIVVLERHKDPFGDYLEDLGFYNPLTKETKFKKERINYWISQGAQPTGSVHNLLISKGIIKGKKKKVSKYKKEEKTEEKTEEKPKEDEAKKAEKPEEKPEEKAEEKPKEDEAKKEEKKDN